MRTLEDEAQKIAEDLMPSTELGVDWLGYGRKCAEEGAKQVAREALYYLERRPSGQAARMATCGHVASVGVDACKRCVVARLREFMGKKTESKEGND